MIIAVMTMLMIFDIASVATPIIIDMMPSTVTIIQPILFILNSKKYATRSTIPITKNMIPTIMPIPASIPNPVAVPATPINPTKATPPTINNRETMMPIIASIVTPNGLLPGAAAGCAAGWAADSAKERKAQRRKLRTMIKQQRGNQDGKV